MTTKTTGLELFLSRFISWLHPPPSPLFPLILLLRRRRRRRCLPRLFRRLRFHGFFTADVKGDFVGVVEIRHLYLQVRL